MRMTRAVSLLVVSLITATALPVRAAGLITALTPSANPVNVNTDVTFTVKGTGGGCSDLTVDYGDGQTSQLTSVSFNNNTNTTTPAHRYAVAKTYAVKAIPGRSCTGTATLNQVVTSATGGGGGAGGGLKNTAVREFARDPAGLHAYALAPRIDTVFTFSVIQPGGGVLVQGLGFGTQPGQLKLKLQNGQETSLGDLQWERQAASGIIDPNLAGVIDQPATLRVVTASGAESNEIPVQFTARRELKLLPMKDVRFTCSSGSDDNKCNYWNSQDPPLSFVGAHSCTGLDILFSCHDSGTDTYWTTLANGWQYSFARTYAGPRWGDTIPRSDQPVIVTNVPGSFKISVYWDTLGNQDVGYQGDIYVEGPAGTSWN